jgi:membrane protein implicated in regulation of membrane protease activity
MNKIHKSALKEIDLLLIAKLRFNASIWLCFVGLLLITTLLFLNTIFQDWLQASASEAITEVFAGHRWQLLILVANAVLLLFSFRNYNRTIKNIREMM